MSRTGRTRNIARVSKFAKFVIKAKLGTRFGWVLKPKDLNFCVTSKCNSRCRLCNVWQNQGSVRDPEIQPEEIKRVLSLNYNLVKDLNYVQITGGEPFLRKDLPELILAIKEILPRCQFWIATNGLLTDIIVEKVEFLGNLVKEISIGISLDGNETTNDSLRGIDGSYSRVLKTLDSLVKVREKMPWLGLSLSFTITPLNFRDMLDVYSLTKEYNVGFTFRPFEVSPTYFKNVDMSRPEYSKADLTNIREQLRLVALEYSSQKDLLWPLYDSYYMAGILEYLKAPKKHVLPCYMGSLSLTLDSVGNVYPCLFMDAKMGNIREQDLTSIWYSERAKDIRKLIKMNKCPNCWCECMSYPNITVETLRVLRWKLGQNAVHRFRK